MTDIQKMIEEAQYNYHSENARAEIDNFEYEGTVTTDEAESCVRTAELDGFKAGANFAISQLQHANRWRKVSEGLPELEINEFVDVLVNGKSCLNAPPLTNSK